MKSSNLSLCVARQFIALGVLAAWVTVRKSNKLPGYTQGNGRVYLLKNITPPLQVDKDVVGRDLNLSL
jgi:hypothetical protein